MHQTRNEMPKTWPIAKKGTKYLAVASHAKTKAIPLVFVLRDILKLTKTAKETRYFVLQGNVKINSKVRKDEKFPLVVFDVLSLEKSGKNYRLVIENKKFALKEISAKEAEHKVVKIIGKKVISKEIIQMNLEDGQNFLVKDNFSVGDSALVNLHSGKIDKIISLKAGASVEVMAGKHIGQKGKVAGIKELTRGKMYLVQLNKEKIELPLKTLLVIE